MGTKLGHRFATTVYILANLVLICPVADEVFIPGTTRPPETKDTSKPVKLGTLATPNDGLSSTTSAWPQPFLVNIHGRETSILLRDITNITCIDYICNPDDEGWCHCDEACFFHQDCCYYHMEKALRSGEDPINWTIAQMIQMRRERYIAGNPWLRQGLLDCIEDVYDEDGFWMASKCAQLDQSNQTPEMNNFVEQCETPAKYGYSSIPVDLVQNGSYAVTFKNVYCALCNGVDFDDLMFWQVSVNCLKKVGGIVSERLSLKEISLTNGCFVKFKSNYTKHQRKCDARSLSTFADIPESTLIIDEATEADADLLELCKVYIMPISDSVNVTEAGNYGQSSTNESVFKNPHCAFLSWNKTYVEELHCVATEETTGTLDKETRTIDLHVILDFHPTGGVVEVVTCSQSHACASHEIYDCVTSECRDLYCQRGYVPVNGRCVSYSGNDDLSSTIYTRPNDQSELRNASIGDYVIIEILLPGDVLGAIDNETIKEQLIEASEDVINDIKDKDVEQIQCVSSKQQLSACFMLRKYIDIKDAVTIVESAMEEISDDISKRTDSLGRLDHIERGYESGGQLKAHVVNFDQAGSVSCGSRYQHIVDYSAIVADDFDSIFFQSTNSVVPVNLTLWRLTFNNGLSVDISEASTCVLLHAPPGLNCSMVAYELNEVDVKNGSVTIGDLTLTLEGEQYIIDNNMVFVCSDLIGSKTEYVNVFEYLQHYKTLTYITSSVSCVCLIAIVAYHGLNKNVRNIHGLNISALALVVLLVHGLLLVQSAIGTGVPCTVYAVVLHFTLLWTFTWMNIIGLDMTRIFTSMRLVSQNNPGPRFKKYVGISMLIPALIITPALCLEFAITDVDIKPNYGDNDVCWLSSGPGIVVFVLIPIGTSLVVSLSTFVFTIWSICRQRNSSQVLSNVGGRSYVIVYFKLTIILGFTWIVGLIGAFVRQDWIWVCHIVLNGSQGLSLLVCSVVNRRVINRLKHSKYLSKSTVSTGDHSGNGHYVHTGNGRVT